MPKILVAEDDHNLARYYTMLLSQWNCETVVEHTGTDAVRRAATFRPDVALLGVIIPEMGGVEAAIKLLEHREPQGQRIGDAARRPASARAGDREAPCVEEDSERASPRQFHFTHIYRDGIKAHPTTQPGIPRVVSVVNPAALRNGGGSEDNL
jgi:CheY-like chemotaxis protein